jgi:hypothetical protein
MLRRSMAVSGWAFAACGVSWGSSIDMEGSISEVMVCLCKISRVSGRGSRHLECLGRESERQAVQRFVGVRGRESQPLT